MFPVAKLMHGEIRKLLLSIEGEYSPFPDDPSIEMGSALQNILFFWGLLLSDMLKQNVEINADSVAKIAILACDSETATEIVSREISNLKEDGVPIENFLSELNNILGRIEEVKKEVEQLK